MEVRVDIDTEGLKKQVEKLSKRRKFIHAIRVYKDDNVLLDEAYNNHTKERMHNIFSCTKSVSSLLIGIAIDKGYIKSVDERVSDLLKDYSAHLKGDKSSLSLKDLLTMRSGIEWDEFTGFGKNEGIWAEFLESDDSIKTVLSKPLYDKPNTSYNYNSGVSHLLSAIIEKNTGYSTLEFAKNFLFEALNIKEEDIDWQRDKSNIVYGGHGLSLKADDLEKIGILYLNKGTYRGHRIVSESWIEESTRSYSVDTRGYDGYGYQLWKGNIRGQGYYGAFGHAGQRIYVFDKLNMVVTFLGNVMPEFGIQESIIREYIIKEA